VPIRAITTLSPGLPLKLAKDGNPLAIIPALARDADRMNFLRSKEWFILVNAFKDAF
jgi:hypothetical protein